MTERLTAKPDSQTPALLKEMFPVFPIVSGVFMSLLAITVDKMVFRAQSLPRAKLPLRQAGKVLIGLAALFCGSLFAQSTAAGSSSSAASCPALLNKTFPRLQDDAPQNLCQYAGKVLLVVNTASYCSFTPQYEGLEKLYGDYSAHGLVVLGFPSNDFGDLEPGKSKEIADFCYNTYGVKFPMFSKTVVSGKEINPLFAELIKAGGSAPSWNFHKYLIGRDGKFINSYASMTAPQSSRITGDIKKALAQQP
jgi:glutathione peroxidase